MENSEPKRERKRKSPNQESDNLSDSNKDGAISEEQKTNFWSDGRLTKIIGLFLILFSFVLFASFTSFLFNASADLSDVSNRALQSLTDNSVKVNNRMGRLGAILAQTFINNLFGLSAYIIPLLSFITGFNLFFSKQQFKLIRWFIFGFFAINWLSSALAFANYLIYPQSVVSWGGGYGNYLTGADGQLIGLLHPIGVGLLLGGFALGAFIWISNFDFGKLIAKNELVNEPEIENIPEYKDETENIFGKDKIEKLVVEIEPIEQEEKPELDEEFEVSRSMPLSSKKSKGLKLEIEEENDEHLDLQLTKPEIEETGKTMGSIGTAYDPTQTLSNYVFPKLEFLDEHGGEKVKYDPDELERNKTQIVSTLNNYQIEISKIRATIGPTVTLYEIVPAPGVRISKIKNLEDDIALSLAALGIRIIAPIPGKGTVGIEVPNVNKEVVSMRSLLQSEKFQNSTAELPICLGKTISNEIVVADLAKMPHLLMAGATGQGKSVGINAILVSLLYKKHPSELKFVMVDPKKVELSLYEALEKHFLAKLPGEEDAIITDTKKVVTTLNALCLEMDNRYELLKKAQVRNLKEYNHKFVNRQLNPQNGHQFLPYIVLVVDEFADLIMTAGKEVEMPIARLAQLARAIGIHLILATQRPSVNIITGTIKANFPARIAFKTTSKIDSRTILDTGGSEQLIGRGDMLLSQGSDIIRLQCGFVDTPEVEKIRDHISNQQGFTEAFLLPEYIDPNEKGNDVDFGGDGKLDELFEDAARVIVQNQLGSTSLIQRRLKLGYNRAGRLMDQLESTGVVGENLGSKAREVKIKTELELEQLFLKLRESR
jgi:DNA segregation ATPase FtsK/SpoIIIE, S-DNA-T family